MDSAYPYKMIVCYVKVLKRANSDHERQEGTSDGRCGAVFTIVKYRNDHNRLGS